MVSKVFGVVSWFPDVEPDRSLRIQRIDRMFQNVRNLFGDVDWLIIAQNWKSYKAPEFVRARATVVAKPKLGILKARKALRDEFLKSGRDWLIMLDDDAIIEEYEEGGAKAYMAALDSHPDGFAFPQYKAAQLNMCAISRHIYSLEPMVDIDPQKGEGFEDAIYSNLLHYKYPESEFSVRGIRCTQFRNAKEPAPSTWSKNGIYNFSNMRMLSNYYIERFKRGNFVVDKRTGNEFMKRQKWIEKALYNGWINKEDVDRLWLKK